jgi:hypothetical protein
MNGILLTLVFLLGVLSAVFITLLTTEIIILNGSVRKQTFQPLPQVEHLQIVDELGHGVDRFGEGVFGIDPDGECEGDNPLGEQAQMLYRRLQRYPTVSAMLILTI